MALFGNITADINGTIYSKCFYFVVRWGEYLYIHTSLGSGNSEGGSITSLVSLDVVHLVRVCLWGRTTSFVATLGVDGDCFLFEAPGGAAAAYK